MVLSAIAVAALSLTGCEPVVASESTPIAWRRSVSLGKPFRGRLRDGVQLPVGGPNHVTYHPVRDTLPNAPRRLWGTDTLVRTTLCVIDDYRAAHPDWPRVVVGDLSRPSGGDFGKRFGGIGHASHQSGRDVDVYFPRWDGQELPPSSVDDVDAERAQELLDRFVAAGAHVVYVGPRVGLDPRGKPRVVQTLRNHDDHLHVRLPRPPAVTVSP